MQELKSTISDAYKGARYFTASIKCFFLCYTMQIYLLMHTHCQCIPAEVLVKFNLTSDYIDSNVYGSKS